MTLDPAESEAPVQLVVTVDCPGASPLYVSQSNPVTNVALLLSSPDVAPRLTPAQWGGTVLVTGIDVVPDTIYLVQADCGRPETPVLTTPVLIKTHLFGDGVGLFLDGAWTPPNGIVDVFDLTAAVEAFRNLPGSPPVVAMDSFGCSPDQVIDVFDLVGSVDGFRSLTSQQSSLCPVPCPEPSTLPTAKGRSISPPGTALSRGVPATSVKIVRHVGLFRDTEPNDAAASRRPRGFQARHWR